MRDIIVSICCQTFNHKDYIAQAVESFLMQKTNFKFDILLRDDASTDGTTEIVKEYSAKYPDIIKPLIYEENQYVKGVPPFMDNVKRAKGEYIAICEGDDYWTDPLKLQKQVDLMDKTNADCCNTLWKELSKQGEFKECGYKAENELFVIPAHGKFFYYHTATRVFKRSVFEQISSFFPVSLIRDTPIQIIFSEYYKVVNLMEYTSVYRISGLGVWTSNSDVEKEKQHIDLYHDLAIWIPQKRRKFLKMKWRLKLQNFKLPKFIIEKGIDVFSKLNHHFINYRYGHNEFNPNK